jgi:hypothetical protein
MRKTIFAFAFFGVISLCVSGEYFIEISPNNEPDYYEMKLGEIVTFEVVAYEKGESVNSIVGLEEKVWWEYDKRLLEKASSDETSITLKAIREGIAQVSATTLIKNNHCQKEIGISITK